MWSLPDGFVVGLLSQAAGRRLEAGDLRVSVARQSALNCELQVDGEIRSQTMEWRVTEEDIRGQPLILCLHEYPTPPTYTHIHIGTPANTKKW